MLNTKMSIQIAGNPAGILELKQLAELTEFVSGDESALATKMILADGVQSGANELLSHSALAAWLDAGKTVAIWNPSTEQLASLEAMSGMGLGAQEEIAAVICTKYDQPIVSYHLSVIPKETQATISISMASSSTDEAEGHSHELPTAVTSTQEQQLHQLLDAHISYDAASPTLYPPAGATFGKRTYSHPFNVGWSSPNNGGNADDYTAGNTTQSPSGILWNDYYVYLVDGEGGTPYYNIVLKQTGSMSPGSRIAASYNSNGYFQYEMFLSQNKVQTQYGAHLVAESPATSTDGNVYVNFSLPMRLLVDSDGGKTPMPFTATEQNGYKIEGWGVNDRSAAGQGISDWYFHQIQTWDPTVNPPSDFGSWWANVFHGKYNGQVNDMPSTSYNNLQFETITAWRVDTNSTNVPVTVSGYFGQSCAFLHNYNGCRGAFDGRHHHLFWPSYNPYWSDSLNLGQIVQS